MTITLQDVEHVAKLARLELTEAEKHDFTEQMNSILKYAEKLNGLNTDDIEPTSHAMPLFNVMREDITHTSLPLEQVFANAPEVEEDQFKVPAVLE